MHPSLVEKPPLSVADLHLFAKLLWTDAPLTLDEGRRCDELSDIFDDFLSVVVGDDWPTMEALVS